MKNIFKVYFGHTAIIFYCFLAISLYAVAALLNPLTFVTKLWILVLPTMLAPFFEWWAHKYLLHRIVNPAKEPRAYQYMLRLHYRHHWQPSNLERVFAPVSSAFVVFGTFAVPAFFLLGFQGFLIFEAAVVSYFLFYEWIHLVHHIPSYRTLTKYGKHIRNAHSWHHYKNENFWWGVTNPLGDYLFGTFKDPKEVESSPNAKSLGDLESED